MMDLMLLVHKFLNYCWTNLDSLQDGRVPERTNGTVSNTVVGLGLPWVQIPPLPPFFILKT